MASFKLPFRIGCALCALTLGGLSPMAGAQSGASASFSGVDRSAFDPKIRAQDDFFRHVNGHWLDETPIPADKASVGAFDTIYDDTQEQLRGLIEAAADSAKGGGEASGRQIGELYASFMDEATIERLGLRPLGAELSAIDALAEKSQLAPLFARMGRLGVAAPIELSIDQDSRDATRYVPSLSQGGLGLPDRDYYLLEDDARFKEVRAQYLVYMTRLLTLSGVPAPAAEAKARDVLALETGVARVQWTRVENRDPVKTYNRIDDADLPRQLTPAIDWNAYLVSTKVAGRTPDVVVAQPSFFKGLGDLTGSVPLATWKDYARIRLLSAYAPFLGKDFVDARFAFVGKVLRGTEADLPRWKRGVNLVEGSVGESLGKLYVERYFPPAYKARMEALVGNLLTAYRGSVETLDWMGEETKRQAEAKLALFTPKIGYPKRWIDYSMLKIDRADLVGNVIRARAFEEDRQIAKLGKPVDRDEWQMTPQTVNAYYNPSLNEIVFPASILQPPFFDAKADDAVNYGAIGAVIGHEISHGFDDSGSQFDGEGNLRDWWTADDRKRFDAKTKVLVAQYGAFTPIPGYPVNGELTLGENIADNAGLQIAYKAYRLSLAGKPAQMIDGLSGDQRFFLGFAQVWRGKTREAAMIQQLKSDPHSPEEIRANGTLRNHDGFYTAFGVKPGDAMYLAPKDRVTLW